MPDISVKMILDFFIKICALTIEIFNPISKQSRRLILAFECAGIKKQQIPRIIPSHIKIPMEAFGSSLKLAKHISTDLLHWAEKFLDINPNWIDGTSESRYVQFDSYKDLNGYCSLIDEQIKEHESASLILHIFAENPSDNIIESSGKFCVVLETSFYAFGEVRARKHKIISYGWSFDHIPCFVEVMCLIALCEWKGVVSRMHKVSEKNLKQLEEGEVFVSRIIRKKSGGPNPINLVPPRGSLKGLSKKHATLWLMALERLNEFDIEYFPKIS